MKRREFCKRTLAGAAGVASLAGTSQAAEEPPIGRVNTRDHFEITWYLDVRLANGYAPYEYETSGRIPGYTDDQSPDEILFWPNAWDKSRADVNRRFPKYVESLRQAGYDGPCVVFEWPSEDPAVLWRVTAEKARMAGRKFGEFLRNYRQRNPETTIHVVGFSLGSEVATSAAADLHERGWDGEIDDLALLGAATQDQKLSGSGDFGPGCEAVYGGIDNFYKTDDDTLSNQFKVGEFDGALGTEGIEGRPPENYEEHQVDWVDAHDYYWSHEKGCIRSVVAEWNDDDDSRVGTDPRASGPVDTPLAEPAVDSFEGSLSGPGDSSTHAHEFDLEDPRRVVVEVTTPLDVDYDIYVAADGRDPGRDDHDFRSRTSDPGEWLELGPGEFDPEKELSLTVSAYEGRGEYWVQVREYPAGQD